MNSAKDFQAIAKAIATFTLIVSEAVVYPLLGLMIANYFRERFGLPVLWLAGGAILGLILAIYRVLKWANQSEKNSKS